MTDAGSHFPDPFDWDDLGFWAIDLETSEQYVSTQVFRMIGLEDLTWQSVLERIHDEDREVVDHVATRAQELAGPYRLEHRFRIDDEWRHFRHRLQSIPGPDGRPARIVGVTTEFSGAGDDDPTVDPAEGDRRVGLLARGMVHDFKNSLAVIAGHADLALHSLAAGPDRPSEHLSVIRRVADETMELTTSLLRVGRRERGLARPVDVHSVFRRIVPLAQATLGRAASVSVEIGDVRSWIVADPDRLESALIDVLINARDAMSSGDPRLVFGYEERDLDEESTIVEDHGLAPTRYGFLSMRDNGVGMDASTLERAIEPLFTTKESSDGSGVGLAMSADFATSAGGTLLLESVVGEGTTITFVIPVARRHRRRMPLRARRVRVVRVVLCGDDDDRIEQARAELDRICQTVVARSEAALDRLLRTEPIDAVLEIDRVSRPAISAYLRSPWGFSSASAAVVWTSESLAGLGNHVEMLLAAADRSTDR